MPENTEGQWHGFQGHGRNW